ncbi:Protein CBG05278 [Caenorhabditis briggsae]|uniref:Protein CBG05278 n=1 Tax=Caenorhabditis briggsae TaxID=6238 RepID=A8WZI8_CAEBR|nr:Protein CBG05278 [Caenorhabditis briggsae]CAP25798.1 Protein CBG05278 [Caenorhabditis briggsae]
MYGLCFTLWAPLPAIVITHYDYLKDAFVTQGDAFITRINRPPETLPQAHNNTGVLVSSRENWRLQRRTSLKILRDFGLSRNLMEEQVMRSVHEMLQQIENINDKKKVDMFWPIRLCVGNVINESLFGYHYKYDDADRFKNFVQIADRHLRAALGKLQLLMTAFPWLRHVPIIRELGYHKIGTTPFCETLCAVFSIKDLSRKRLLIKSKSMMERVNQKILSTPTKILSTPRQMKQTGNPGLDMPNLCSRFLYPEIQDKVREKIFEVVGTSRLPSMSDKPNMPYTQAVIHEVQRHSNMIPVMLFHTNTEDVVVKGQNVPTGTLVFGQIWSIMKNDSMFDESQKFNPSRYLQADGKTLNNAVIEKKIPFGIGKKACAGEGLARMELFLIFSAFIQKYEFIANSNIDLSPDWGGVLTSKSYTCQLIPQTV